MKRSHACGSISISEVRSEALIRAVLKDVVTERGQMLGEGAGRYHVLSIQAGQRGHCLRDDGHGLSAVREWCHEKLLDQLRRSAHLLGRLSRSLARQSGFPAPACRFIRLQCFRLGVVDKQLTARWLQAKNPVAQDGSCTSHG